MGDSERSRVGPALDLLAETLVPYVGSAMESAYGQRWDRVVAKDDAARRKGKEYPINKKDLAVLLKSIIHRPIAPWSTLPDQVRIRAYASEVLSLRHAYAHGHDCSGEYERFLDTANRLLTLLGLAVPKGMEPEPPARFTSNLRSVTGTSTIGVGANVDIADVELAALPENCQLIVQLLIKQLELSNAFSREMRTILLSVEGHSRADAVNERVHDVMNAFGAEALALLREAARATDAFANSGDEMLAFLIMWMRCEISESTLQQLALLYGPPLLPFGGSEHGIEGEEELGELADFAIHPAPWRHVIQLASRLEDTSPLVNFGVARANLTLAAAFDEAGDGGGWSGEALPYIREAIARLRFLAAREPGTGIETALAATLRLEGKICVDSGRTSEAIQAFARADEVIDRYPTAAPALLV